MRLFIAVNFEHEIKQKLVEIQEKLKKYTVSGNFTAWENIHLTLVFFGEKDNEELIRIKKAMSGINLPCFKIDISGLGSFRARDGNTWWMGIADPRNLIKLQSALIKELQAAGIGFAEGRFLPHITLARQLVLKQDFNCAAFNEKASVLISNTDRVSLMESSRRPGRLVYDEIYSKQLL